MGKELDSFGQSVKHDDHIGREPWYNGYGRRLVFKKVVGLNPSTRYWIDIFSHNIVKNCNDALKKPESKQKEAGFGKC